MHGAIIRKTVTAIMLPLLRLTASELQHLLTTTSLTSQDITLQCLSQIASHNHAGACLNAIISVPSHAQVLARAKLLDDERSQSGSRRVGRGPLHGIPVVVKDQFCTPSLGMDTTCGSFLLKGQKAIEDAVAIRKLQDAGAIILGKANLTELGHKKGVKLTSGWSAVGGQTQSPYVRGGVRSDAMPLGHSTPAGSSSGNAVAVAAGFCPVAIGTESDGSVMFPCTGSSPAGAKPTTRVFSPVGSLTIRLGSWRKGARTLPVS